MRWQALTLLAFGVLPAPGPSLPTADRARQEQAVAEVRKAKGVVVVDEKRPGRPVVRVDLGGVPVRAEKWAHLLKAFPQLEEFSAC